MGTRDKPIPVGVIGHRTSQGGLRKYDIVIKEAYRGSSVIQKYKTENGFDPTFPTEKDKDYLLVYVEAKYIQGPPDGADKLDESVFTVLSDSQFISPLTLIALNPKFDTLALPGATIRGWIVKQVFADDPAPLLAWGIDPSNGNGGMYFSIK